jgi:nucleotide-binding universal stress UspA family protein
MAEKALGCLARFVFPTDTQLVLVGVLETLRYVSSRHNALERLAAVSEQYERYFQETRERLQAEGYEVTATIREGDAATEILNLADSSGADLIAMMTHGRSGVARWILGSVAERVLQGTTLPLLLVREQAHSQHGKIQRLLVPLDGSALAERALTYAQRLAQETGAEITLLRVLSTADVELKVSRWPPDEEDPAYGRRVTLARSYLKKLAQRMQESGVECRYRVLRGDPGSCICTTARRSHADMIVMTTRGCSGVTRWILGSVANEVIRGASCPVMVVPDRSVAPEKN